MNLSEISIRRPVAVLMVMLIVVLLGVVSYTNLNIDLLPKITPPVAAVITTFRGASANEVADLVTVPLESVAVTTSGIKDIMSISQEGVSIIVLTFEWGQDMSEARSDITQKLELVPLPEDASKPTIMKFDPTLLPVMQVAVSQFRDSDLGELTDLTNDILQPRLEGVEGVAAVEVLGGLTKQVEVSLDPDKLSALGLTQDAIAALISASNLNYPLGKLNKDELHLDLRLEGKFKSVEDLESLVVGYAPPALLKQITSEPGAS
ncbi:MAG TPA: efflux RND transporter permease subunit, partial [Firmicutes bacterium]|nr:efflux RND transporter permease subunit [Candidatus Fermentithermobacillaceae bacterium]